MDGRFFISYSRGDATEFAGQLADRLVAGSPLYSVWLDVATSGPVWNGQSDQGRGPGVPGLVFPHDQGQRAGSFGLQAPVVPALKYKKRSSRCA